MLSICCCVQLLSNVKFTMSSARKSYCGHFSSSVSCRSRRLWNNSLNDFSAGVDYNSAITRPSNMAITKIECKLNYLNFFFSLTTKCNLWILGKNSPGVMYASGTYINNVDLNCTNVQKSSSHEPLKGFCVPWQK